MTMSDINILLMEIARIALEDDGIYHRIAHELDLSDEELDKVRTYVALEDE
jgi:hypothetical protein